MTEGAGAPDPGETLRSRRFLVLLVLAAAVGVIASVAAWGFLQLVHYLQEWVFTDLPRELGYGGGAPDWWYLLVLFLAGVLAAFAIVRLPGHGGHVPADGLSASPITPVELPGVILAALASIGLGLVLGPEAPLIALGGGLGYLLLRGIRSDAPEEVGALIAASGMFAAVSFLFGSPVIAAVILIEASGLGGRRLPLVLIPGLLASGIGWLVSLGMGSWTGLDSGNIALEPLKLPDFARPDLVDFLWTVPFAIAIAVVTVGIFAIARLIAGLAASRTFVVLPAAGLAVAGLAIAYSKAADRGVEQVLFSGETAVGPLVANPDEWSLSALALVIAFKGLAYAISLGSFRGGPVFPAMFLGAAAGMMVAQLPGMDLTPAVAVGMGAAVVAILRLPLSAVVLATLLTIESGVGAGPLVIVGVVVAYLTAQAISPVDPPDAEANAARA